MSWMNRMNLIRWRKMGRRRPTPQLVLTEFLHGSCSKKVFGSHLTILSRVRLAMIKSCCHGGSFNQPAR